MDQRRRWRDTSVLRDGLRAAVRPGSRVGALEMAIATALLAVLGAVALGPHVVHGGFYNDDWAFSTTYRYREHPGILGAMEAFSWMSFRPLAMVWWPLNHGLFGTDPTGHLALAAAAAVVVSAGAYLVLRMLGMARLHAGAVSGLVLLFPAGDASKLWAAAAIALPAIAAYLFGTAVALRGLRSQGRASWLIHAGAVGLYLVSVLTYEVASGAVLVSILIYRLRTGWRRAASRWIVDVAAILPVNLIVTSSTWNDPQPIATQIRHVGTIIAGGRLGRPGLRSPIIASARSPQPPARNGGGAPEHRKSQHRLVLPKRLADGARSAAAVHT